MQSDIKTVTIRTAFISNYHTSHPTTAAVSTNGSSSCAPIPTGKSCRSCLPPRRPTSGKAGGNRTKFLQQAVPDLSPAYLDNLVPAETGKSFGEYLRLKMTGHIKKEIRKGLRPVEYIAAESGLQYPGPPNLLFKQEAGCRPEGYTVRLRYKLRCPNYKPPAHETAGTALTHMNHDRAFPAESRCRPGFAITATTGTATRAWPRSACRQKPTRPRPDGAPLPTAGHGACPTQRPP